MKTAQVLRLSRRVLSSRVVTVPLTAAAGMGLTLLSLAVPIFGRTPFTLAHAAAAAGLFLGTCYATGRAAGRDPAIHALSRRRAAIERSDPWKLTRESAGPAELTLAGARLAASDEVKHFKFIGTTGTGKSTAIAGLLEAALARGDRAVIADPDGGYLRRFYDPKRGDVILNPFDQRSVKWDLFGEIRRDYDIDQLARSLLPDHEGGDRIWRALWPHLLLGRDPTDAWRGKQGCERTVSPADNGRYAAASHPDARDAGATVPRGATTRRCSIRCNR